MKLHIQQGGEVVQTKGKHSLYMYKESEGKEKERNSLAITVWIHWNDK
jgi:hypothetical protein